MVCEILDRNRVLEECKCGGLGYVFDDSGNTLCCDRCGAERHIRKALSNGAVPRFLRDYRLSDFDGVLNPGVMDLARGFVDGFMDGNGERFWLYLFGGVGTGKSCLSVAVLADIIWRRKGSCSFLWRDCRTLIHSVSWEKDFYELQLAKEVDVLVLDDFGVGNFDKHSEGHFWMIMTERYHNRRATVFTSNLKAFGEDGLRRAFSDSSGIGERMVDRVNQVGSVVVLKDRLRVRR